MISENEKAEREVEAFIRILKEKHGVDIEDLKKIDFKALDEALQFHASLSHRGDQAATTALRIIVTTFFGALIWLIYEGFKHLVETFKNL